MRYALASVLVIMAGPVSAQSTPTDRIAMPIRDVNAACSALADGSARSGGASRNTALALCIQEEQQGYDTSKLLWGEVSLARRGECLTHASDFGPPNFYRALGLCLEAKLAAEDNGRQMHEKPQGFRY